MTVKELAEFTGKTERAVQKWIVKAGEKSSAVGEKSSSAGHGKIADYTIDEVEAILTASSFSPSAVSVFMENARGTREKTYTVTQITNMAGVARGTVYKYAKKYIPNFQDETSKVSIENARKILSLLPPPDQSMNRYAKPSINNKPEQFIEKIFQQLSERNFPDYSSTLSDKVSYIRGEISLYLESNKETSPTVRRLVTHAHVAEITDGSENHPFN